MHSTLISFVEPYARLKYDISIGACEIVQNNACHGLTAFADGTLIFGMPSTFHYLTLPDCNVTKSNHKFTYGKYPCVQYQKGRLYCMCKQVKTDKREIIVLDSTNYVEIIRWKVANREAIGAFAIVSEQLFVGNKDSIDVYTLRGKVKQSFSSAQSKLYTDMTAYGSDQLAVCDYVKGEVVIFNHDGKVSWSKTVIGPFAICTDWMLNLWVWSKEKRRLMIISGVGECLPQVV